MTEKEADRADESMAEIVADIISQPAGSSSRLDKGGIKQ
jgi:hypothetical protein